MLLFFIEPADYSFVNISPLTITPSNINQTCFPISVEMDSVVEEVETFFVQMTPLDDAVVIPERLRAVTVQLTDSTSKWSENGEMILPWH